MNKTHRIKLGISIVIIGLMGFFDFSFAAESSEFDFSGLGLTLNYIVSVLAWFWVFFAKVAGEFLTNKWVYGEIFGWDALLWKFRNIVKNMANYGLGFFLVYMILKGLIDQYKGQEITKNLKQTLLWSLIAGVGIQASRFLTGAIIDISTITLVAAGSFPSQIISGSDEVKDTMIKSLPEFIGSDGKISKVKRISLFPIDAGVTSLYEVEYYDADDPQSITGFIDKLMPNADDVSGPLYFIGFSILETDLIKSVDSSSNNGLMSTIFNTLMQGGTTIIFSIEMLVLCVVAVMRIIYLRMFIALSPLTVLLWCIEKSGQKLGNSLSSFTKQINFTSFFINVFKPTMIVLGIGMAAILVSLMTGVVDRYSSSGEYFSYKGVSFSSTKNTTNTNGNEGDQTYTTTMDSNLINFTLTNAGKTLLGFVLSIITVIMVYQIIMVAVKMGGKESHDFVTENIGKLQDSMGKLMMSMPVVPVAGYDKQGVPTTHYITADKILKPDGTGGLRSEILEGTIDKYGKRASDEIANQETFINNLFSDEGEKIKTLPDYEKKTIKDFRNQYKGLEILRNQKAKIKDFAGRPANKGGLDPGWGYGMTLNPDSQNKFWLEQFEGWLSDMNGNSISAREENYAVWNEMIKRWNSANENDRTIEKMFKANDEGRRVEAYAKLFDLKLSSNTWDSLKNADFSRK